MITVVLIEPENSGNIGAIARVMANFDFKELVLVNPKCEINEDSRNRAKHAQDILRKAKMMNVKGNVVEALSKRFDYLIGTTAIIGTDYNIPRCPLTPEELAEKIASFSKSSKHDPKIALLFGREGHGLFNNEIEKCDFIATIPTSKSYKTMNISHSATIILYELFKRIGYNRIAERIVMAGAKEKEVILNYIKSILGKLEFPSEEKKIPQLQSWKKVLGKAMLTKREAFALCGFFRKINLKCTKK